jgi:hypothetical protein
LRPPTPSRQDRVHTVDLNLTGAGEHMRTSSPAAPVRWVFNGIDSSPITFRIADLV